MAIASIDLNVIAIAITFAATTYHPDNQSKALTLMPEACGAPRLQIQAFLLPEG
jgi:hypothetical protein